MKDNNMYVSNLRRRLTQADINLHVQNEKMAQFLQERYDQASLEALRSNTAAHEGLTLLHYANGGASAVTPYDLKDEIQSAYKECGRAFVGKLVAARPGFLSRIADHQMIFHLESRLQAGQLLHQVLGYDSHEEHLRCHQQPQTLLKIVSRLEAGFTFSSIIGVKPGLESAIDGGLLAQWDRDRIMQCLAEMQVRLDPDLGKGTRIEADSWKKGLISCLTHHFRYASRFVRIIKGEQDGRVLNERPHIHYNAINGDEFSDPWGNGQNDALALIGYMLFFALNRKDAYGVPLLQWNDADLYFEGPNGQRANMAATYIALLHHFLLTVHAWEDFDNGAWEDFAGEHASSIGCVLGFLREELEYVKRFGTISAQVGSDMYFVTEDSINNLMGLCWDKLMKVLPNEFVNSEFGFGRVRRNDVAITNAMLLAAYSGIPFINDEFDMQVINGNNEMLMGPIGHMRYLEPTFDIWDGTGKPFRSQARQKRHGINWCQLDACTRSTLVHSR